MGELGGNDSKAEHKFCLDEEGKVLGTGSGIGILENGPCLICVEWLCLDWSFGLWLCFLFWKRMWWNLNMGLCIFLGLEGQNRK